jgi:alpha-N-acetylglucosamine transferase
MSRYAYVTILYGDNIYFLGAIIMGYTLRKTRQDKFINTVIMITNDVPEKQREVLRYIYDRVILTDYIYPNKTIIEQYEDNRFKEVFTKLRCLELVEYDKIMLLDLDMLVINPLDNLFLLNPPVAVLRSKPMPHGLQIPQNLIVKNNKLIGGINAGLMVLKPDINELKLILEDIQKPSILKYKNPEQDYLSFRYSNRWTNIDIAYNYQVGLENKNRGYFRKFIDIHCLHFSSRVKPWKYLYKKNFKDEIKKLKYNYRYYKLWKLVYDKVKEQILKEINVNIEQITKIERPYKYRDETKNV